MRKNYIAKIIPMAALTLVLLQACKPGKKDAHAGHTDNGGHKDMVIDTHITRLTQPVNSHVISELPSIQAEQGTRIVNMEVNGVVGYDTRRQTSIASRAGGRIERLLIKYNYQPVKKGQLVLEIYSPDLAAAQRELLMVAKDDVDMLQRAKQRLSLLGMQPAQITELIQTGKVLYRVPVYSNSSGYILETTATASTGSPAPASAPAAASGGDGMSGMGGNSASVTSRPASATPVNSPVMIREGQYVSAGQSLFTIYQATDLIAEFSFPQQLAPALRKGQRILYHATGNKNEMLSGIVGLIEPVFRNGQNFMTGRVYGGRNDLQVGQLLTGYFPVIFTEGWWLPKQAVWHSGNKSIVFKKEGTVYHPVEVNIGVEAGNMIQVRTDLSQWQIAVNAAYLVDSESFIRTTQKAQ